MVTLEKIEEIERISYDSSCNDDFVVLELLVLQQTGEINLLKKTVNQLSNTLLSLADVISRVTAGSVFTFEGNELTEEDRPWIPSVQ